MDGVPLGSTLPPAVRGRLVDLFGQIVQEFEVLYAENEALHQQLGEQSDRLQGLSESSAIGTLCMILGSQVELQCGLVFTLSFLPQLQNVTGRVHGASFASASSSPPTSAGYNAASERELASHFDPL